jgi:hypothetical protein
MAPPNDGKVNHRTVLQEVTHPGDRLGTGADAKNPSFIEDPKKIPVPGLFGIRWGKTPGEIDNLNKLVDAKCKYFLELSKRTGEPVPPEVQHVLNTGKPSVVYKERWTLWPMISTIVHTANVIYSAYVMGPLPVLALALFSYIYYDIYSGVLHIVLDNPLMMKVPLIDDPTLEFQWHHHIPQDLTSKSFLEVCGDLNMVSCLVVLLYVNPIGPYRFSSPMSLSIISCKLLMAYFGQLCHAMSHMPVYRRPSWVVFLQNKGIMISPQAHWGHHKNYDDNYCIGSGIFNRFLTPFLKFTNAMHKAVGSNDTISAYFWLVGFLAMSVFDVPVLNYLFTEVFKVGVGAPVAAVIG